MSCDPHHDPYAGMSRIELLARAREYYAKAAKIGAAGAGGLTLAQWREMQYWQAQGDAVVRAAAALCDQKREVGG